MASSSNKCSFVELNLLINSKLCFAPASEIKKDVVSIRSLAIQELERMASSTTRYDRHHSLSLYMSLTAGSTLFEVLLEQLVAKT